MYALGMNTELFSTCCELYTLELNTELFSECCELNTLEMNTEFFASAVLSESNISLLRLFMDNTGVYS